MLKPQWLRLDVAAFRHPKIQHARTLGGDRAVLLWLQGLAYSVEYLSDGWVPPDMPATSGHTAKAVRALERAGLWIPVEVDDCGGWLIHDYTDHQITRAEWHAKIQQRRDAARKRWVS
jgi:hypothetical protein